MSDQNLQEVEKQKEFITKYGELVKEYGYDFVPGIQLRKLDKPIITKQYGIYTNINITCNTLFLNT